TSLGQMVGSLTIGKKKYAAVEAEMQKAILEAGNLSGQLLTLVDKDAEAFEPLSKAYGLPKETVEEKAVREETMEKCLKEAAAVPFAILETLAKVTPLLSFFAANGSDLALSDAGCGAALASGAAKSALLNVLINTKSMTDHAYAEELSFKAQKLCGEIVDDAEAVYNIVLNRYI
ncbi:MAG: cyclodeaminase/cyclohydrolase family protein, partial [bacterium]